MQNNLKDKGYTDQDFIKNVGGRILDLVTKDKFDGSDLGFFFQLIHSLVYVYAEQKAKHEEIKTVGSVFIGDVQLTTIYQLLEKKDKLEFKLPMNRMQIEGKEYNFKTKEDAK